jgi:hypothetical protein
MPTGINMTITRLFAASDGHDRYYLIDELVPVLVAVIDEVAIRRTDDVRAPVVAPGPRDVLYWAQFQAFGQQRGDFCIAKHDELSGYGPSYPILKDNCMGGNGACERDRGQTI